MLALFAFAGCAKHETRVAAGTRDQILHIGNSSEPKDLDPNTFQAAVEWTIDSALFEGLVNIANDGDTILPGVAERWDISADGLVYTFHLRPDAQWSDGSPLTADDFLFSFRRVFTPSIAASTADQGYAIAGARDYATGRNPSPDSVGVRALDPRTFEIRLEHPAPYLLCVLGGAPFMPVPRHVIEKFGGATRAGTAWTRLGNIVSNGAFVLKSWQPHANLTVARNPRYWDRGRVRLNEVRFYPIESGDTEERAFRAGQLHVTFDLPPHKLSVYRDAKPPQLHVTPLLAVTYVIFNTNRPPFDNARVRRALSLAVDRDRLVANVLHESASPAHSLTRPGTGGYSPPVLADYDPLQARRLLAEAGYPGGVGFPQAELLSHPGGSSRQLAEALQQIWQRELGVRLEIAQQESKVMIDALEAKNYQVALTGYFYGMQAPEFILTLARSISPSNQSGWKNPVFDQAFTAADFASSVAARHAAFDQMEQLVHAEAPYAPIYSSNKCQLIHPSVRGWRDNALYVIDWRELSLETPK